MRFTQDLTSNVNFIRGYAAGEIRINDSTYRSAVIVGATALRTESALSGVDQLSEAQVSHILELQPELVLLGTGARQIFPATAFSAQFLQAGIGFEVMDTGAACRTFNVLVGEQRHVVALLLV